MTQRTALLSVFDKTGIVELARALTELGWKLVSSGGTAKVIHDAGIPVTDVAKLTGVPAILGHRVVTLHPKVHGGILAIPTNQEHAADMKAHGIKPIQLVVGGLYPFSATVASGASFQECIEKIDIGGPTLLRGAAKNHEFVGVVTDPSDYQTVLQDLRFNNALSEQTRQALAIKAFAHTARYDTDIVNWMSEGQYLGFLGELVGDCKYGENPYMTPAKLYQTDGLDPLAVHRFESVEGDERSFINLTDVDCLLQAVTHLAAGYELNFGSVPYMAVGVKHGNACGAAVGSDPVEVVKRMVAGDKRAIFGGVVMTNFPITREVAEALMECQDGDPPRLFDGVFGPSFADDAPAVLKRYQGKCRMMANPALENIGVHSLDKAVRLRPVRGGFLTQPNYTFVLDLAARDCDVYGRAPSDQQKQDIITAWAIGCISNSNTITLVHQGMLIGNGVGQQDRVGAAELAIKRARDAGHNPAGAAAWSDSFFPAPDGPRALAKAGITAIFASSGSKKDGQTIYECGKRRVSLLMQPDTKVRGFAKH